MTEALALAWTELGEAVDFATANWIMFVPASIGIVGAALGLFKRAIKVGGRRR